VRADWWRRFFETTDSLELSFFPDARETGREIRGLRKLLGLTRDDRIADICCGFGRHTVPLLARKHNVVGLDASAMMLLGARFEMENAGVRGPLVRGDAACLPFTDGAFDVVLNLFNSFGYFADDGQNLRVLSEAHRVLKPGGRFFLDTRNREFQILYAPYCQTVTVSEDRDFVLRCSYDRERRRLLSRWSLPGKPQAVVHEASIRLYGTDELRELLERAGFLVTGVYGNYQGHDFEGWHRQMIYVAVRQS
jgi:SAM-dependent methyltransferase